MEAFKNTLRSAEMSLGEASRGLALLRAQVEELRGAVDVARQSALCHVANRARVGAELARHDAAQRSCEATLHELGSAHAREVALEVRLSGDLGRAKRSRIQRRLDHGAPRPSRAAAEAQTGDAASAEIEAVYAARALAAEQLLWSIKSVSDRATSIHLDIEDSEVRVVELKRARVAQLRSLGLEHKKQAAQQRLLQRSSLANKQS